MSWGKEKSAGAAAAHYIDEAAWREIDAGEPEAVHAYTDASGRWYTLYEHDAVALCLVGKIDWNPTVAPLCCCNVGSSVAERAFTDMANRSRRPVVAMAVVAGAWREIWRIKPARVFRV